MAAGCALHFPSNTFAADDDGKLICGAQLFMVRRQAATDLAGILKAIQEIGYTQIEASPAVYSHPAGELMKIVADAGFVVDASADHFTELGNGTIAWPELLEQTKKQRIEYAFLDQDEAAGPVVESMTESFSYLKKNNL